MRGLTMLSTAFLLPGIAGCTPAPAEQARIDQRQATERADLDKALRGLIPSALAEV